MKTVPRCHHRRWVVWILTKIRESSSSSIIVVLRQPPPQAAAHARRCHGLARHRCAAVVLGDEEGRAAVFGDEEGCE
jgi:hypothetical protein